MKTLTIKELKKLPSSHSRGMIETLFKDRDEISLPEILKSDIPAHIRIWFFTQKGILTPIQQRVFCSYTANRAVRNHCLKCGNPIVEEWAKNWISGKDRTDATAWKIALTTQGGISAKQDAAGTAAASAAWAAQGIAENTSVAARGAARGAAKDVEDEAQLADLRKIVK